MHDSLAAFVEAVVPLRGMPTAAGTMNGFKAEIELSQNSVGFLSRIEDKIVKSSPRARIRLKYCGPDGVPTEIAAYSAPMCAMNEEYQRALDGDAPLLETRPQLIELLEWAVTILRDTMNEEAGDGA